MRENESRRALLRLALIALIWSCAQMAHGQAPDPGDGRAQQQADYRFPEVHERINALLRETFGPRAFLQSALAAGARHLADDPPEWRQGATGFNRRLASRYGQLAVQNGIELGLGAALQQDLRYRRCECNGILRRTGHAIFSNFTAHTRDGGPLLHLRRWQAVTQAR